VAEIDKGGVNDNCALIIASCDGLGTGMGTLKGIPGGRELNSLHHGHDDADGDEWPARGLPPVRCSTATGNYFIWRRLAPHWSGPGRGLIYGAGN